MMKTFTAYIFNLRCLFLIAFYTLITLHTDAQNVRSAYLQGPVVYINLMLPSADSMLLIDGTAAIYSDKYTAGIDQYDAYKLPNFLENICLRRDNKNLAIEARPIPKQNDTLFLKMWGLQQPSYNIQVSIKDISGSLASNTWLVDNYLHTRTPINLYNKTTYNFTSNTDTSSYENRFMIVFNNNVVKHDVVASSNQVDDIKVIPNPVTGNRIGLQFTNVAKNSYKLSLSTFTGNVLKNINIVHNGGSGTYYLPLNSVFTNGLYTITISSADAKKIIHLPVILNN